MIPPRSDCIPTPWPQRLRCFRRSVLPGVIFGVSLLAMFWLWEHQGQMPNAVGEVEAVRIDVAATAQGTLAGDAGMMLTLFERIEAGAVVARLDDGPARAAMATVRARITQLQSELRAAVEKTALQEFDRGQVHQREACRLACEVQKHRLDVLDRRAAIETDRIEEQRLETQIAFLQPALARGTVTELQVTELRLQRDEVRKRIEENERALAEAQTQGQSAAAALRAFPELRAASVELVLAPVEAAIAVGERELEELQLQVDALEVRAPISGTICGIYRWPGQAIKAGEPIVTVAADQGRYIVSYVRQEQRIRPAVGMAVTIRVRGSPTPAVESVVERVGPHVELVPPHHLRDQKIQEWGQPVSIRAPQHLNLRPGELIDVTFPRREAGSSSS
jgi:multidrug resistance efflux pump